MKGRFRIRRGMNLQLFAGEPGETSGPTPAEFQVQLEEQAVKVKHLEERVAALEAEPEAEPDPEPLPADLPLPGPPGQNPELQPAQPAEKEIPWYLRWV